MSGIFISYRREDTGGYSGRLFDVLSAHFGDAHVFMDIDTLRGGDDFARVIAQTVDASDVLLAMIGDRWVSVTDARGNQRLNSPDDFVRIEITRALERGTRVIPVLVGKATIPNPEDLPESLRPLCQRQSIDLRDAHFHEDCQLLIEVLQTAVTPRNRRSKRPFPLLWTAICALILVAVSVGIWFLRNRPAAPPETKNTTPTAADKTAPSPATPPESVPAKPIAGTSSPAANPPPRANFAGIWHATVTYDGPNEVYNEVFDFEVDGSRVIGTASHTADSRAIVDGKIEGNRLSFTTKDSLTMDNKDYAERHYYKGVLENNVVHFSLITESDLGSHPLIHFTATRVGTK